MERTQAKKGHLTGARKMHDSHNETLGQLHTKL